MLRISVSSRAAKVGAAVTAVGLGAAGYGIAWAATGPAGQAPGAGSDLAALAANNSPGSSTSPGPAPGPHGDGPRGHRMFRGAGGTLSAVGPDSITVTGPGGRSHTIGTNSSTTYSRDGATAARSDLAVGQRVRVRLVPAAAGGSASGTAGSPPANPTAAGVDIVDPRLGGTVSSVQGPVITVSDPQGFWRTIDTSGTTRFMDGTSSTTLSAIKAGDHLVAFGTIASDHTTLDATLVRIVHPGTQGAPGDGFGGPRPMMRGGGGDWPGGPGPMMRDGGGGGFSGGGGSAA